MSIPRLLGLVALVAATPQARADDPGWQLSWRAPPGCPDSATVEQRIASALGAPSRDSGLRVAANVHRDRNGWTLDLVARRTGGRQRRRLHHRDCATLAEATALLVMLAVDPTVAIDARLVAALRSAEAPRFPPKARPPATRPTAGSANLDISANPVSRAPASWVATAVPSPVTPAPKPRDRPPATTSPAAPSLRVLPRRRQTIGVRLAAGIAAGATPAVSGGLLGALVLALGPRARIELTGSYWAPRRAHLAQTAGPGADISLAAGGLRGCAVPRRGRLEVPLCLGAELGSMRATGVAVSDLRSARSLWLAMAPGMAVVFILRPRLAIWLGLDGLVNVVRPQFVIDGAGEVWRASRGGIRGWLGIELRFLAGGSRRR